MPRDPLLYQRLLAALPDDARVRAPASPQQRWPLEAEVPGLGLVRLYARTCTTNHKGRDKGEFAAQMTGFGGVGPRKRGRLDLTGAVTALLGFAPAHGVWTAWQPYNHRDFANSKSIQIFESDLEQARVTGWAVAPVRETKDPETRKSAPEVRVAFRPYLLMPFLRGQVEADAAGLVSNDRAHFLAKWPLTDVAPTSLAAAADGPRAEGVLDTASGESVGGRNRGRISQHRLERSRPFALNVRKAFGEACAACGTQLGIIEAAHLIPVTDPDCRDEVWNGLALCRNHHALFDAGAFVVDRSLRIQVRDDFRVGLKAVGLTEGAGMLLDAIDGKTLMEPSFWADATKREHMQRALDCALALRPVVHRSSRHRPQTPRPTAERAR